MEKSTAQHLIRQTLKAPFDRTRYRDFVNELCNGFAESKTETMEVPAAFGSHVKSCRRLGTYTSPIGELVDILIVRLTEADKLERSRTALRNFVAHKLKRGDGENNAYKEAGLVAFVAPDAQSWRFSYVRMEYTTKRDQKTGKIQPEEHLTPARRYSYLVGALEECHTAQSRFLALLQNTVESPTLAQFEEAFSVEAVTKAFFKQYAALFSSIETTLQALIAEYPAVRAEFQQKQVRTVDFAKKLLGQMVFLYFLQRKGWLGVQEGKGWGTGPQDFLRQLANRQYGNYTNFFNDALEPLFYDTLATDRGDAAWCPTFSCRIPFLNGGLFEPLGHYDWRQGDVLLPDRLFTNTECSDTGGIGTGILDVFDRYNFTVNEAEPLEKEVAIDPEMLGKVFENLIEDNRRKGLGAFYTPREIVYYMCQESLINYLDTSVNAAGDTVPRIDLEILVHSGGQMAHYADAPKQDTLKMPDSVIQKAALIDQKLADITVCDPAVGSGVFPVGMMTEIVRARSALTPYFDAEHDRTSYHFKRHAIQHCLYGVDIETDAVEIAKLRLWLSLVVDEEDVQHIKPLPNLVYKIVAGNALLGVEKDLFNEQLFCQLERLKLRYFDASDQVQKASLRQQIEDIIHALTKGKETFDFEIYFSEVFHGKGGFDVVVGNPPYLFLSGKGSPVQQLIKAGKHEDAQALGDLLNLYAQRFPHTSRGCRDFYKWFADLAFQIVKPAGAVSFITPNTYFVLKNYADLRKILFLENSLEALIDLGFEIFDVPVVPSAVFLARRCQSTRNTISYCDLKKADRGLFWEHSISTLVKSSASDVPINGAELLLYKHSLAEKLYVNYPNTLQKYASISEGEHKMIIDLGHASAKPEVNTIPAILDAEMARLTPMKVIYIPQKNCPVFDQTLHVGARFFLRKTGDRIIAAPAPNNALAVAHQNVYVCHAKLEDVNTYVLVGLLNTSLLTFLYQNGIYGQKGRTMAQFRIYALYLLPFPELRSNITQAIATKVDHILTAKQHNPSADTTVLEREIDQLVYTLYGLTPEEIHMVEGAVL